MNRAAELPVQKLKLLSSNALRHGFTSRTGLLPADGDISYVTGPDLGTVRANRDRWAGVLGVDSRKLVCAQQVHGNRIRVVTSDDAGRGYASYDDAIGRIDGLITQSPGLPLAVFCADCVPMLLFDPVRHAIGAIHAGWRGTVANIAGEAVRAMNDAFGTDPGDLLAGIGPSIGRCCYEVGAEVVDAWASTGFDRLETAVDRAGGHLHFDLWKANTLALNAAGVLVSHIEVQGDCTCCQSDRYFSYRAHRRQAGRFAGIIALENPDGARDGGH